MDVVDTLGRLLRERAHRVIVEGPVVVDLASQLSLRPLVETVEPIHGEGMKTVSTIEIKHPARIPFAIFEYQHATGRTIEESLVEGFRQWYEGDFVPLQDAVRDKAVECLELAISADPGEADSGRRITLGPVAHFRKHQIADTCDENGHCFCPCCLFTNSIDAFRPLLPLPGFFALRFFAMRDEAGHIDADCRVNGEDHDAGKQALIRYATTWPQAGFEFRKQYVLIQSSAR